jgi:hypothetical protein
VQPVAAVDTQASAQTAGSSPGGKFRIVSGSFVPVPPPALERAESGSTVHDEEVDNDFVLIGKDEVPLQVGRQRTASGPADAKSASAAEPKSPELHTPGKGSGWKDDGLEWTASPLSVVQRSGAGQDDEVGRSPAIELAKIGQDGSIQPAAARSRSSSVESAELCDSDDKQQVDEGYLLIDQKGEPVPVEEQGPAADRDGDGVLVRPGGPSEPEPNGLRRLSSFAHGLRLSPSDTLRAGSKFAAQMFLRDLTAQAVGQTISVGVRSALRYGAVSSPVISGVAAGAVVLGMSWFATTRGADLLSQVSRDLRQSYDEKGPALRHYLAGAATAVSLAAPAVNYLVRGSARGSVGLLADTAGRMAGQYVRDTVAQHLGVRMGKVDPVTERGRTLDKKEQMQRLDPARLLMASTVYAGMSVGSTAGLGPYLTEHFEGDSASKDFKTMLSGLAGPAVASTILEAFDGLAGALAATVATLRSDAGYRYTPMGEVPRPAPQELSQLIHDNASMRILMGTIGDVMATAIATTKGDQQKVIARACAGVVNGLTELRGQLVALGRRNEQIRLQERATPVRTRERVMSTADDLAIAGVDEKSSMGGMSTKRLARSAHAAHFTGCLAYVNGEPLGVIQGAGTTDLMRDDGKSRSEVVVIEVEKADKDRHQMNTLHKLDQAPQSGFMLMEANGKTLAIVNLNEYKVLVSSETRSAFADLTPGDPIFVEGQKARFVEWKPDRRVLKVQTEEADGTLGRLKDVKSSRVGSGPTRHFYTFPAEGVHVDVPRARNRIMAVDLLTSKHGDTLVVDDRQVRFQGLLKEQGTLRVLGFRGVALAPPGQDEGIPALESFLLGEHRIEFPAKTAAGGGS